MGTRYKYQYTQYHIVKTIVGLYGHYIKDEFPIQGNDGKDYTGYWWLVPNGAQYLESGNYVVSLDVIPAENLSFTGTNMGKDAHIYYYVEIIEGEDLTGLTIRNHGGKTYKLYKDVITVRSGYLTRDEEFHDIDGYTQGDFEPNGIFNQNPGVQAENYLYYTRNSYNLEFRDSNNNEVLTSPAKAYVQYQKPLTGYNPINITPISKLPGYVFKGWYSDQSCDTPFDWDDTMPNHDVIVYAGWEQQYYRIEVDPAGGQLTEGESTFFWLTYGDTVKEYGDITRDFVRDDANGTYYYHYHPYTSLVEFDSEGNKAIDDPLYYGKWGRIAKYDQQTTTEHYVYNPNKPNDDGTTGGYDYEGLVQDIVNFNSAEKYRPEAGAYALVGWYKVNADGSLGSVYNFSEGVTADLKIRAVWRRTGAYHVRYTTTGYIQDASGNLTANSGVIGSDNPNDTFTYADKSESAVMKALTPPDGYAFVGWRYDGQTYQPGDVFTIKAEIARDVDGNKTVFMEPVFMKVEDLPVEVTSITIDGNGGKFVTGNDDFTGTPGAASVSKTELPLNSKVTLPGEGSFVRPGYDLKGWAFTNNATSVNFAFNAIVGMDNIDRSAATAGNDEGNTLYAVWEETYVNINYQVVGPGGQVNPTQEIQVPAATGNPTGSTASVLAAYEGASSFDGWFLDEACTQHVPEAQVTGTKFTPAKNSDGVYVTATYYAKFTENTVTLNYVAVGPAGENFGSVDPASETLPILSGIAQGSTATVSNNKFKFVGWYDNAECSGNPISTAATYVPTKASEARWVDRTTYYAKFEYNLANLTITKQGADDADANQTFIFKVVGKSGTQTAGTVITVTIHGNGSVTISDLLIGEYTVTEVTDWSWRYDQTGMTYAAGTITNGSFTLSPDSANNIVTVTNTRNNDNWLSGDSYAVNVAGTGRKP